MGNQITMLNQNNFYYWKGNWWNNIESIFSGYYPTSWPRCWVKVWIKLKISYSTFLVSLDSTNFVLQRQSRKTEVKKNFEKFQDQHFSIYDDSTAKYLQDSRKVFNCKRSSITIDANIGQMIWKCNESDEGCFNSKFVKLY